MTRGQLPKAYLRIDPNIDQTHPDNLDAFIRLLCAGNRQPVRGQFRTRRTLDSLFGKTTADRFYRRGDVANNDDGTVDILHWDLWQEGDMDVAERMRKLRARRHSAVTEGDQTPNNGVTPPSHTRNGRRNGAVTATVTKPSPASEASRRLGVKASDVPESLEGSLSESPREEPLSEVFR